MQAAEKKALEEQVAASRASLASAELIRSGVKKADMDDVQSGDVLLAKENCILEHALRRLEELNKQIYKKPNH